MRITLTLAVLLAVSVLAPARADTVVDVVVEQTTDVMALSAHEMFRFEPQLVRIKPGDSVTFRNSMADHTVHSIPEIWPEDAEEVHISHQPEVQVTLDQAGVYGITCARHGQYGMVMLILVGEPDLEPAEARIDETRLTPDAKKEMQSLFDAARAAD